MRFVASLCIISSFVLVMAVSACGVKPSTVEKPADKQDVTYPRSYPDPSTDPRP